MKFFFLLFLLVPLLEIYFLIQVGSVVGAGTTVLLVVFTALLGAVLVRAQGFSTLARVQTQLARGNLPALEMLEGLLLFAAGALLLTPGFFTDAVGFVFLIPPLRRKIIAHILKRGMFGAMEHGPRPGMGPGMNPAAGPGPSSSGGRGRVIDVVDYEKVDGE